MRFELVVAVGGRRGLLQGPSALGPEPGRRQVVGEVSPPAEAFGVRPGMTLGEAVARCPELTLVAPDPVGAAEAWEGVLRALEGMGAAVEPAARPGLACFAAPGLERLHGGLEGVIAAAREALSHTAHKPRLGAGGTRFAAIVAAAQMRSRRGVPGSFPVIRSPDGLAGEPISLLALRDGLADLPEALERLGISTLGDLAALPRDAVADRFGRPGLLAHDLVTGVDTPLVARVAGERLEEALELPEAGSGAQLHHALGLLVDRLLARRERRGRTLRAVVLAASLVGGGGTWRERIVFREAIADPERMRLALGARLALLPAPADTLRLVAEAFGPPFVDGATLFGDPDVVRRARLQEAVHQARAVAGPDAALRALVVDPDSRVPERRVVLTPFR